MRWLIKSATIVDPNSPLNGKKRDILIQNGKISDIKSKISDKKAKEISFPNLHVSPGWVDTRAHFADPGEEYKEGLQNGLDAAAAGGFTHVVSMPDTTPVIDSKGQLEYLLRRSDGHATRLCPAGALSQGSKGKQLAELYDMHCSGAVMFTDGHSTKRTELMRRALEYTKTFGGVVGSLPFDEDLSAKGNMHEGVTSTMNGLKAIPTMAETIRIMRDIELLRYTGGRLHFMLVSSAEGLNLIKRAKKEGLEVTCGVSVHHLMHTDEDLVDFNSNLKVSPPFRSKSDRSALLKAVKDGTVDVICSDHRPEDVEHKKLEFPQANFGIGAIEDSFSVAMTAGVSPEQFVERTAHAGRKLIGLEASAIQKDVEADLTLFDPSLKHEVNKDHISLAYNNPYVGQELTGKVFGVIRGEAAAIR
ncbi:MAG: dihydroorotase [Flavobacteriales bacterium]|nr:dihydroorotase [Flavobacteriales bacterium]